MHLLGWDYLRAAPDPSCGLSRLVARIDALRSGADACLLVDNGDFLQGTLLGDWHVDAWRRGEAPPHPMIAAMTQLGYDAAALGNHEMDFGLDYLSAVTAEAGFPILSSNLHGGGGDRPVAKQSAWTILERTLPDAAGGQQTLRIGLFAVLPPQTMQWNRRHLAGQASVSEIVSAGRRAVAALRDAGAEIVIALSHSGIAEPGSSEADEHASLGLARVPGIDAMIAGHAHRVFPGPDHAGTEGADCDSGRLAGLPAVMPGRWGSHLGQIDLALLLSEGGGWQVAEARVALHAEGEMVQDPPDALPDMGPGVARAHAAAQRWGGETIGESAVPLHSYFAPLYADATGRLMAAAQTWAFARWGSLGTGTDAPLLAAVCPLRAGTQNGPMGYLDNPAGPVSRIVAATLYPFANALCAIPVSGAQLRDWLDHAAAQYRHIPAGAGTVPLMTDDWTPHNFDIVFGLEYRIDLSVPPRPHGRPGRSRILDLCHAGRPVQPLDRFLVVTNEYRACGGGAFPGCEAEAMILGPDMDARVALEAYLADVGRFAPSNHRPVFAFAPVADAAALFCTGPGAQAHLSDPALPALEPMELSDEGFARYTMALDARAL